MKYDPRKVEDKWFAVHERDLIKRIQIERERTKKALADAMDQEEARRQKDLHWMHCPKCGAQMHEEDMLGIKVDLCPLCDGTFFDQSELQDLFLKSQHERKEIVFQILNLPPVLKTMEWRTPDSSYIKRLTETRERKEKEIAWLLEQSEAKTRKELHWMKCPKCGADLIREEYEGVSVETCSVCQGVYLERQDFQDLILKGREERRNAIMRIIRVFSS